MTRTRKFGLSTALIALVAANPASAEQAEPALVVEKLSNPDPDFVPPPPEKRQARVRNVSEESPTLDQAFENLGRVAGQAAQLKEQRYRTEVDKLKKIVCNSVESARAGGADVSAWEQDCK